MIIKAVDLASKKELLGKINPFKREINVLKEGKPHRTVYGFPSYYCTFRIYNFPFKDRDKIKKALETQLQIDLPISIGEIEYDYILKECESGTKVFCVVAQKNQLIRFDKSSIVDSEIFALLRLAKQNKIDKGEIIHFNENYIIYLKFEEYFPHIVKVLNQINHIPHNAILSGFIPKEHKIHNKILTNPIEDPSLNIAYGLLLKMIDNTGINLLKKFSSINYRELILLASLLISTILILNLGIYFYTFSKKYKLEKIKQKEKEVYVKYFDSSGKVFDPLLQAKGLVSNIYNKNKNSYDASNVLKEIGKAKSSSQIKEIFKISITPDSFTLSGKANSINNIEKFINILREKYETSIEETINTPDGEIRFTAKGKIK